MYTSNEDIQPLQAIALMKKLVTEGDGKPDLTELKNAADHIRANAIVREFIAKLMLSRKRVAEELRNIATDIS